MEEIRTCLKYNKELPISGFYAPSSGFRYVCKNCDKAGSREYNRAHRAYRNQYDRNYARTNPRRKWTHACLASHRRSGYVVKLTSKELFELATKTDNCFVCGCKLNWGLGRKWKQRADNPSLDRLDNERMIRKDNVAILCYRCNATKQNRTLTQFIEYCAAVAARFHSHFE